MDAFHGTTIVSARRGASVAMGGDGQVTLGNIVVKQSARKVRRLYHGAVSGSLVLEDLSGKRRQVVVGVNEDGSLILRDCEE